MDTVVTIENTYAALVTTTSPPQWTQNCGVGIITAHDTKNKLMKLKMLKQHDSKRRGFLIRSYPSIQIQKPANGLFHK